MKEAEEGWFKYAQTGLELAVAVLLGFYCGYKLDARFGSSPWLMLAGSAAGMAAGFYLVVRELPKEGGKKPEAGSRKSERQPGNFSSPSPPPSPSRGEGEGEGGQKKTHF